MGIFRQFPYSNFHDMNMDEIIKAVKDMLEMWAQYYDTWDNWKDQVTQEWAEMQSFINNYFDNLNVQTEINNKITSMVISGEFSQIVDPYVPPAVAEWLAAHITTPETVIIDDTLTIEGAAADAKATGEAIDILKTDVYIDRYKLSGTVINGYLIYPDNNGFYASPNGAVCRYDIKPDTTYVFNKEIAYFLLSDNPNIANNKEAKVEDARFYRNTDGYKYLFVNHLNASGVSYGIDFFTSSRASVLVDDKIENIIHFNRDPQSQISDNISDINYLFNSLNMDKLDNIGYDIAKLSRITETVTSLKEINLGLDGIPFQANHTYLMYASFKIGVSNSNNTGSIYPYFRDRTQYQNITIPDGQRSIFTFHNSQIGDEFAISGFITPNSNIAKVCGWMVLFNGAIDSTLDLIPEKSFIVDITNYNPILVASAIAKLPDQQNKVIIDTGILSQYTDLLFWGDSLTAGAGGNGVNFPSVCANELGLTYINCGVGGENANTIAARQGGNNILIPIGSVNGNYPIANGFNDLFGGVVKPLIQGSGYGSGSTLYINGHECSLSINDDDYVISGYPGSISTPAIATFYGNDYVSNIVVIFVGTNGATFTGLSGVDARIAIIDSMIHHLEHHKYIIMGLSVGDNSAYYQNEENKMLAKYGNKYFSTRKMLVRDGLTIAGITPTAQDTTDIANGTVPTSLRSDSTHLNEYGYTALGKMMAEKIHSLRYVE